MFHVLLAMAAVILVGRALGRAFAAIRQPPVVGEVVAGILLGPSLLGRVAPAASAYILPGAAAPLLNFFLERYTDAYRNELEAFLKALEDGSPMPTTPRDGRQALRLADCALQSVSTGCTVKV